MQSNREINLIILAICYSIIGQATSQTRIIGGTTTTISAVPYLVQLRSDGLLQCGGALVTRNHVVTAAHCVSTMRPGQLLVVGGATRQSDEGIRRGVKKIIVPATFSLSTMDGDIAVLVLRTPMTGTNTATISLANRGLGAGDNARVSGWGVTRENASGTSNVLRTLVLPAVSKKQCNKLLEGLTDKMFCLYSMGQDTCNADSGGPVVRNGKLVGVVSWGEGCARAYSPGVYTSVPAMRSFLNFALQQS